MVINQWEWNKYYFIIYVYTFINLNNSLNIDVCIFFPVYNNGEFIVQKKREKNITFIMTHKHSYT